MDSKILTELSWKTTAVKCKVKDNGLQRCLANYGKCKEDEHEKQLKEINEMIKLATALKKSKEVMAAPAALKHLEDLLKAAQGEQKEVSKAKELAAKADLLEAKAEAAQAKAAAMEARAEAKAAEAEERQQKKGEEEEDEDDTGDYKETLKTVYNRLKSNKELEYNFIVCDAKPRVAFVMTKQRISAKHKAELTSMTGSKRFLKEGKVSVAAGKLLFEMEDAPNGLAAKLKLAFKYYTGINVGVMVGEESDEDEVETPETQAEEKGGEQPEEKSRRESGGGDSPKPEHGKPSGGAADKPAEEAEKPVAPPETEEPKLDMTAPLSIGAAVGQGGRNTKEDVEAVQAALNKRANAGLEVDGKCGPKTIAAIKAFQKSKGLPQDGRIDPGKNTERALNGEAVEIPKGGAGGGAAPKGGGAASGGAAGGGAAGGGAAGGGEKPAPAGGPGIVADIFGVAIRGISGAVQAAVAEAVKQAQEAEARKRAAEARLQEILNKILKVPKPQASDELKKIKAELEKAQKELEAHKKKIAQLAAELAKRKTAEAAEKLRKAAEIAIPGFKQAEDIVSRGADWLEKNAPGVVEDAKDIAKRIAKEIAEQKAARDKAYKDALEKIAKAIKDGAPPEAKKIKDELEQAYKDSQKHIKGVEDAAKQFAKRKAGEAEDTLKRAAEAAGAGFKLISDTAQRAWQWADQNTPKIVDDAKDIAKKVAKDIEDKKKAAEKAYKDTVNKFKKAAEDQLPPEGKQIKDELEKAYDEAAERAKAIKKAAEEFAKRKTEEAQKALDEAAERAKSGIKSLEDKAKGAWDWITSD